MINIDKYLDLSDEQIDNLLMGFELDTKNDDNCNKSYCKHCKSSNLVIDNIKGHIVCTDCAVVNKEFLDENPTMIIAIHGHTDNHGDEHQNLTLSTDRAYSVMNYLQEIGIDKERMSFKGFGQTKPLTPNSTAEGRAQNRRTEFVIVSK